MNTKYKIVASSHTLLADLQTPVGIYLKVRDMFSESALLESSDYHSNDNSYSFIGVEPIARFIVSSNNVTEYFPDGKKHEYPLSEQINLPSALNSFIGKFEVSGCNGVNGLLGYTAYDSIQHFENVDIANKEDEADKSVPDMIYILYRYIIAVNHLRNEMTITENLSPKDKSNMSELVSILNSRNFPSYDFKTQGEVTSPISDNEYMDMVREGIKHCLRGDVFQIVLSRRFQQRFQGDDFKVYRALRSINPSPYLFYFDFGSFRIFGSSPETHVKIENSVATIDPIAGTFRRTGNDAKDEELAKQLLNDPKENAEHVMLVDLARNDLSRNTTNVNVKSYKALQFYSHVIHMVSRVCGEIIPGTNPIKLFADTFPAGTLSGAPKVKAMQLINTIEKNRRGAYGGCIGYIGFDGSLNQAITIRTFLSKNNTLYLQAGGGIVAKSEPENELKEVNGKLGALRKALELANTLKN
ncbi:MAG: anthranilate synthase component I family protein [Prevotellaceae bacterium]|jgi:anthranilate synthase component 1|nr:anthranilate synthase component I family protein [Prevotellaceae bacterium]